MITNLLFSVLSGQFELFAGYELRRGDNDKKKIWGGSSHPDTYSHVEELQLILKKVGTYVAKVDGDFGGKTDLALKLFQSNAKTIPYRIKNGSTVTVKPTFHEAVSGKTTKATRRELAIWSSNTYQATGDLIRLKATTYSNIELNPSFKLLRNQHVTKGEFVVSVSLLPYIKTMNIEAKKLGLKIVINQSLRQLGIPPKGAVVTPAKRSQHYIGHAVDVNIVDGSNWNTSATFKAQKATNSAKLFIAAMKKAGLRWGGNFSKMDSPHFDRKLDASTFEYEAKHFFNQTSNSNNHILPLVI
ncbi:M15 family metallopeptidase [Agarivorans sp. DSG3-1]|uniref:M15 family metallopeptidase n=1 Tax=Agarivorans sp. DSG3-1 TaxID=3342249 RepID=UPI00398F6F31